MLSHAKLPVDRPGYGKKPSRRDLKLKQMKEITDREKEGEEGTQTCFDDGTALFAFLAAFLWFAAVRANDGDTSETIRHGWLVRRPAFRVRVRVTAF